jgi:hypothetical protein
MHLMSINNLSDFIQVIYSKRTNYAINEYFTKHIQFTTIYLLLRQKSNPKKYSEQKINMENLYNLLSMMFTCMQSLEV